VADRRRELGARAEQIAAEMLDGCGYRLIARNARTRHGEIDLIVRGEDAIVFVEVKAGHSGARAGPERPAFKVDRRKQLRIRRLAAAWLAEHRPPPARQIRAGEVLELEHIEAAF
jgi:putative endonuclease